jgi:hypothetical protein
VISLLLMLMRAARALIRRRSDLVLENLALRQQVAAFAARGRRPRLPPVDRWFWRMLRRSWSRWTEVLVFVKPETSCAGTVPASVAIGPGCRDAAGAVGPGLARVCAH